MSAAERDKLRAVLKARFALDDAATDELIDVGTLAENEAVDLYHFTSLINRSLDEQGRLGIVEMMWEVVFADGRVNEFEDNLMWRAADLLGVSSRDRIAIRRRVAGEKAESERRLRRRSGRDARGGTAMSIFKPVTVITGASVGIGAALARVFATNGHEVALVARREKEMVLLATELAVSCKYKPHVITADLQRTDAPARIAHELLGRGLEPAIVVNNAGFGLHGPAAEPRPRRAARDDRSQRARAHRSVAALDRRHREAQGRHPECRLGRGLPARPRHGGLLRLQGLRAVVHRGAVARARAARRARHRALSRPGADRIPDARRHRRRSRPRACSGAPPSRSRRRATTASWRASAWSFRASATRS